MNQLVSGIELDKEFKQEVSLALGKVGIRVVVFKKKPSPANSKPGDGAPLDQEAEEDFTPDSEVGSYLEQPKRGKLCCVFLLNGQRHHGLDNSFIVNNLGMKYLRKRMIIVVDLDGLTDEARAEIMQGSRVGLYEGRVYQRIQDRIVSSLKKDPDLLELEDEAEQELARLQVGDAAVQEALDQLITSHFDFGDHTADGGSESQAKQGYSVSDGGKKVALDVVKVGLVGTPAASPVLLCSYERPTLRLYPGERTKIHIAVDPKSDWQHLVDMVAIADPELPGLTHALVRKSEYAVVELAFDAPPGFNADEYPLECTFSVLATFKNQADLRLLDKLVVIKPRSTNPPPPPPNPAQFKDVPTFLKVGSRQPIRLVPGGDASHVKLRWDGKDELCFEPGPRWRFEGTCIGYPFIGGITFTSPTNGRFAAIVHTPPEIPVGAKLRFDLRAIGPGGQKLTASFTAETIELPSPKTITAEIPRYGQRRPPYQLVIVREKNFADETRWGSEPWSEAHGGAFIEPKPDKPLRLCINEDFGLLRSYLESLAAKKADEQRTEEKKTKYVAHIAYHLYQMYLDKQRIIEAKASGGEVREPQDDEMQQEVNRVAGTLIRLMEVSR